MRQLIGFAFLTATALASAQIKLNLVRDGQSFGTATLTQKLRQDGSKQVQMSVELSGPNGAITIRSESIYLASGVPQRKFQEVSVPGQKYRKTVIAEFSESNVHVTLDMNGARSVKDVALPKGTNAADKSEFWFVRDKPKAGDKVKCSSFNLDTLAWDAVETTYVGQVDLKLGQGLVKAQKTQSSRGVVYVDDQGLPYKLELPNGVMERVSK
jgi:hypothetical protein